MTTEPNHEIISPFENSTEISERNTITTALESLAPIMGNIPIMAIITSSTKYPTIALKSALYTTTALIKDEMKVINIPTRRMCLSTSLSCGSVSKENTAMKETVAREVSTKGANSITSSTPIRISEIPEKIIDKRKEILECDTHFSLTYSMFSKSDSLS